MKNIIKFYPLWLVALTLTAACQSNNEENFSNKAYINAKEMTSETIIKGNVGTISKTITIATARPAEKEVNAQIIFKPSLFYTYTKRYYTTAELLPNNCFKIIEKQLMINKGSVKSNEAKISFFNLGTLDRSKTYIFPVEVETEDIDLLGSRQVL